MRRSHSVSRKRTTQINPLRVQISIAVFAAYLAIYRAASAIAETFVPGTRIGLLSNPDKMPGSSFGLPAHKACPRAWGSICDDCYASKGCYRWANSERAQAARFAWTVECMRTDAGMQLWISVMIQAIFRQTYFRIHDSGDFFNVRYVRAWIAVCKALPATKFWAPTRAWQTQGNACDLLPVLDPMLAALRELASLPNVTVRPSALNFGDLPPVVAGLAAGSTADCSAAEVYQCPAKAKYDGHCGPCRVCWDSPEVSVNYPKH